MRDPGRGGTHLEARKSSRAWATPRRVSPIPPGSQVILDLETKVGFDQLGGSSTRSPQSPQSLRSKIREMGISIGVTYAYADDSYRTYFEEDTPHLVEDLFSASRTIGFNIRRFDYEVLRRYTRRPLKDLPTLDLLEEVHRVAGHRVSLGSLLKGTLRTSKAGDGMKAIEWYRQGEWKRLEKYCREDVRATKALYEHGRKHGRVAFWDRRQRRQRSVRVHW